MADIQLRGLRLWVSSVIHWPARQLQNRLDATEHRLEEIREDVQAEVERRALLFEKVAAAWAVTALLVAIAGLFFLLGCWLGFAFLFGPVAASFLLAVAFIALAPLPLILLRRRSPGPLGRR